MLFLILNTRTIIYRNMFLPIMDVLIRTALQAMSRPLKDFKCIYSIDTLLAGKVWSMMGAGCLRVLLGDIIQ